MAGNQNQGVMEMMTGAIAQAVAKLSSRKIGIAVVGMWLISNTLEMEARNLIFWLCIAALASQMVQDIVEILATGKDLPETNRNGDGRQPETSSLEDIKPSHLDINGAEFMKL